MGIEKMFFIFFRILSWLHASAILDLNRGDASSGNEIARRSVCVSKSTACIRIWSEHFCMATLWTLNMYRLQIKASGKIHSVKWMHLDTGWKFQCVEMWSTNDITHRHLKLQIVRDCVAQWLRSSRSTQRWCVCVCACVEWMLLNDKQWNRVKEKIKTKTPSH